MTSVFAWRAHGGQLEDGPKAPLVSKHKPFHLATDVGHWLNLRSHRWRGRRPGDLGSWRKAQLRKDGGTRLAFVGRPSAVLLYLPTCIRWADSGAGKGLQLVNLNL